MKENGNKQFWDRWSGFYDPFMHSNEVYTCAVIALLCAGVGLLLP